MSLDGKIREKGSSIGQPRSSKSMSGKETNKQNKDSLLACLQNKAEKQLVPTNNRYETLADMNDLMDMPEGRLQRKCNSTRVPVQGRALRIFTMCS